MNRLGGVDELNNLAIFLSSDASTFMTGSDLICDVCLLPFSGFNKWMLIARDRVDTLSGKSDECDNIYGTLNGTKSIEH